MKKILLPLILLLLLLTGCDGKVVATDLVGTWECLRLKQVLVLDQAGGVELTDTSVGYGNYQGSYMLEGKTLTFDFPRFSRPVVREVKSAKADKIILLDVNGIEEVYLKR